MRTILRTLLATLGAWAGGLVLGTLVRLGATGAPSLLVPFWYVSPTGACSDFNAGTSAAAPLCHLEVIYDRWGTTSPLLTVPVVITLLTSFSPPFVDPMLATVATRSTGSLLYQGTPIERATATIGVYVPLNRTSTPGTRGTITAAGQTGAFWTQHVGRFVQDTTATPTAWFWIEKDLGSATATITPPFTRNPGVGFNAPTYATIASGDSLVLYDETQADCAYVAQPWADSFGPPQVDNLWCANTLTTSIGAYWYEDRFSSEVRGVTGAWPSMVAGNDFFDSVSSFQAPSFIVWGGAIDSTFTTIGNTQGASNDSLVLDADVILAGGGGEAFHMQGGVTIGRAYLGSGPDTDACQNGAIMLGTYDSAGVYYADAELYGPAGLDLHDGCTFQCERSGCTGRLLITGGLTVEGEASSYPWGVASHAWGAPVAITAANIDSSGAIGDPSTGNFFRQ